MNADEIVRAARGLCARSLTGLNKYHGYIATKSSKHGEGVYDAIIERLYRHEHGTVPELCDLIQSLQTQLSASQRREKAAVELAGKLIALCDVPKEWRDKLFRRHVNRPGVYMGSGYDFLDGFYRLFDDFSETADEETYRAVRLVAEKEFEWPAPQDKPND